MSEFLNFDQLITTKILKGVYLLGTVLIGLGLLAGLFGGVVGCVAAVRNDSPGGAVASLGMALLYALAAVLGAVMWRVYCEMLIVAFKINDNLQELRDMKHAGR